MESLAMSDNGYTSRDAFLGARKRRYRDIILPDGSKLRIQSITERERSEWESHVKVKRGQITRESLVMLRARLICLCVVDEDGNPLFRPDDASQMLSVDSAITNRLFEACQEHCGISDADVEGLEKNCERTPAESSATA